MAASVRHVASPLGELALVADGEALVELRLPGEPGDDLERERTGGDEDAAGAAGAAILDEVAGQLDDYFAGRLAAFDLPLRLDGTPFQRRVWTALLDVPYGQTVSYAGLAAAVGRPGAARAVGRAVGQNPIAIIVPCHRVIGSDGSLTGYGGGLPAKRRLLDLEAPRLPLG